MSSIKQIGEISHVKCKVDLEWKINNFFSFTEENVCYRSPDFYVLNSVWKIAAWPNGKSNNNNTEWVSLYLYRTDGGTSKSVDFAFGIKTKENIIENKYEATWKTNNKGIGWLNFMKRAELEKKKEYLVPAGNLIIICSLTIKNDEEFHLVGCKDKLVADLKNMFLSKQSTDVTIKVKKKRFSVNKFILTARSPVFAAMFKNDMIEKKTGSIAISDCDPDAFRIFLLYLYSGELESEKCDFFHLYKIADKYCVPELKTMCIDFLIQNISLETFCELYLFGIQFNEKKLLTIAQIFFNENFKKVVNSDNWLSIMKGETDLANNLLKGFASKATKIEN